MRLFPPRPSEFKCMFWCVDICSGMDRLLLSLSVNTQSCCTKDVHRSVVDFLVEWVVRIAKEAHGTWYVLGAEQGDVKIESGRLRIRKKSHWKMANETKREEERRRERQDARKCLLSFRVPGSFDTVGQICLVDVISRTKTIFFKAS